MPGRAVAERKVSAIVVVGAVGESAESSMPEDFVMCRPAAPLLPDSAGAGAGAAYTGAMRRRFVRREGWLPPVDDRQAGSPVVEAYAGDFGEQKTENVAVLGSSLDCPQPRWISKARLRPSQDLVAGISRARCWCLRAADGSKSRMLVLAATWGEPKSGRKGEDAQLSSPSGYSA
ncbi:hypothetical protein BC835DRAFT_167566 [Cytidiella melzeri]|nr:hypothetical protein BC835DRAFT_167566 [Cytidiella melzeri]